MPCELLPEIESMSSLSPEEWTRYLHEHIPVSRAMAITVLTAEPDEAVIQLPLTENLNHRETAFGGSISTAGILVCWLLFNIRMREMNESPRLVVRNSNTSFLKPIADSFTASCRFDDAAAWAQFLKIYQKKGRGKLSLTSELSSAGERCAIHSGEFVALRHD